MLFPFELSVNILFGASPVAHPFIVTQTGTALNMWSMYVLHFSLVIFSHQNFSMQSDRSSFVRGPFLAISLFSSLHTFYIGFRSGLSEICVYLYIPFIDNHNRLLHLHVHLDHRDCPPTELMCKMRNVLYINVCMSYSVDRIIFVGY